MKQEQIIDILQSFARDTEEGRVILESEFHLIAKEIAAEEKTPEDALKSEFEEFRKMYKAIPEPSARVRGLDTEWTAFKKKHKDYHKVVGLLRIALRKQLSHKEAAKKKGEFFPFMKNMSTWLSQRDWESWMDAPEVERKKMTF
jgi:hypothetical protein